MRTEKYLMPGAEERYFDNPVSYAALRFHPPPPIANGISDTGYLTLPHLRLALEAHLLQSLGTHAVDAARLEILPDYPQSVRDAPHPQCTNEHPPADALPRLRLMLVLWST